MSLILATDLIKLPVAALDTNSRIGTLSTLLIDTDRGLVVGFTVVIGWFGKPKFLSMSDIHSIDQQGIVIQTIAKLVDPIEVVQAKKILQKGFQILKQPVKTETNKRLGRVSDLLIDTQTGEITKFYIHGWLSDRIIPKEKIIKITKQAVIVEDEEPVKAEPAFAEASKTKPATAAAA